MSLSDVSDLTDLSSDEDDFPPSKTRTKASKKGSKEYKISGVLRAPRTTSYTAKSLYDQIIDNAIDLDPEYQRDVVWPELKQSGLIDSMLRNYYMPPVIFAVSTADDGTELRTCIDGKQRLTSIQRFMDGQIPHKDSFTNERLWYKPSATNARRKLLPKQLLHQFANKQIVCVEYSDINPDQEREIFHRVQLGVALTPAERMQAIVGPWPTIIREIQSQVLGENGFQGYLDWGHARGRDFQCMASIGYLIENHPKPTVPSAPTLEKWLLRSDPVSPKLREDLLDTFRVFLILARDQKYSRSLNKPTRVSPIEFVMIGVLIYLFRDRLSLTQLSSAIEKMRKDVRDDHKDIRANSRITKHMVSFMNKRLKISELKTDGEGDKPAAGKPIKAKKRKRVAEYDDSEEEEKPRKVAASKAPPAASLISKSKSLGSASKKKTESKSNPVPTKVSAASAVSQSKHKKASPDSRPPIEQISQAPLQAKAPLPTSAPPATYTRPSPPLAQVPPFQSNTAVLAHSARPSPTPIGTNAQASSMVKSESHTTSLYTSPAITSSIPAADRLGPIRAAKEAIRTNTGFQVQSPVAPHTEHKDVTSVSNLGVNGSAATHDPRRAGSSSSAVAVLPQQQSPHPLYNGLGYQFQINPSEVEALLRVHGLVVPHNQQMPMNSPVTLPEQVMTAMQSGANVLSGISASTPGPSNFSQGVSVSGSGQGVQPVPAFRYLQGGPQQLYLLGPSHNGFPNGTHPAPHHSLPPRPSSTAPAPVNTGVSTAPMLPPPHSASSTGSFKDDRRHSEYERRDYSKGGGSYDKDYRRNDSRWDSSGRGSHRGRDSGWGQRGRESWRKP